MSAQTCRAVVLLSLFFSLLGGCAPAPGELGSGGSGGQGGVLTGVSASDAATTSGVSSAESSTGSSGAGGAGDGGGGGGQGGGEPCDNTDPGEPNNTEATAYSFGKLGCSDSPPGNIYGILAGVDDVDWFVYDGQDEISCQVNPTVGVAVKTGIARVCAYFACVSGSTEVGNCPIGTNTDTSPDGRPGCCGTTDFTVSLNCTGTINDESLVYLRVDDPTHASVCAPYTVVFHY